MFPNNNYGYYPQPQQSYYQAAPQTNQSANQLFYLKGRPVSSIEEARAMGIDFDGSVFFFPDLANKRIYTKQINQDGTATLNMYELKNEPVFNASSYITREEFEMAMNQMRQMLEPPQPSQSTPAQAPANIAQLDF